MHLTLLRKTIRYVTFLQDLLNKCDCNDLRLCVGGSLANTDFGKLVDQKKISSSGFQCRGLNIFCDKNQW